MENKIVNKCIWKKNKKEIINKLSNNLETDVLIIGSGITGLTTAYLLLNKGLKITIVDNGKDKESINNNGIVTYLDTVLNNIKNIYDDETALEYLSSQLESMELIQKIIIDNDIKCNYESKNTVIYNNNTTSINFIKKLLNKKNIKYKNIKNKEHGIKVSNAFSIDPFKYLKELENIILNNNIEIFNKDNVNYIEKKDNKYIAHLKKNTIISKYVVVATYYPSILKSINLYKNINITFKNNIATKIEKTKSDILINSNNKDIAVYNKDNYYIYSTNKYLDNAIWDIESKISNKITNIWSNKLIFTNDYLPFIGKIDNNLFIATGFNNNIIINSTLSAKIISDLIQGINNKYIELFDPYRKTNVLALINSIYYSVKKRDIL